MEVQDGTNLFVNPAERNWQPHQIPSSWKRIHRERHSECHGFWKSTGGLLKEFYKWISGKCLPSLDNFLILSRLLNTSIEDILVIDGDIPRFRSKYREIRERLNRWYNDKIVILWYSEEKAEKEPVKKVLERENRCQQEYVLATAI